MKCWSIFQRRKNYFYILMCKWFMSVAFIKYRVSNKMKSHLNLTRQKTYPKHCTTHFKREKYVMVNTLCYKLRFKVVCCRLEKEKESVSKINLKKNDVENNFFSLLRCYLWSWKRRYKNDFFYDIFSRWLAPLLQQLATMFFFVPPPHQRAPPPRRGTAPAFLHTPQIPRPAITL